MYGRIRISTTLSGPTDWGKGTIYSISENGVGCVKLYSERTDLTRKLDGRASHFQAKLHFTTNFTFKKGKLKVKFTLFGKYFQSKIQFQDKNIHKPIFPPPSPNFPIKKKAPTSVVSAHKKKEEPGPLSFTYSKKKLSSMSNIDGIELFPL